MYKYYYKVSYKTLLMFATIFRDGQRIMNQTDISPDLDVPNYTFGLPNHILILIDTNFYFYAGTV